MAKGIFWTFAGTAIAKLLTFAAGVACAHLLQKEAYGQFGIVRSAINMFIIFGAGGLGVTATKYVSEYRKEAKTKISSLYLTVNSFGLFVGVVCTSLVLFFSHHIATYFLKDVSLSRALSIGAVLLFFSIINGTQSGTLMGFEDFKSLARNTLIGGICETVFMLLGAYYYGVDGAVLGFGLGFIVIYVANRLAVSRWFKKEGLTFLSFRRISLENLSLLLKYSLPATFSALLITPVFFFVRSLLVKEKGFAELAIFEAADQYKIIILFIPTAISQIVLPILSSLYDEHKTFIRTLKLNIAVIGILSAVISTVVYLLSGYAMSIFGKGFDNVLPLQILAISTVFSAIANVLEMGIYSLGKVWNCLAINMVWALAVIGISHLLLQQGLGAEAIALAVLAAYMLSCLIFTVYMWSLLKKM